MWTGLEPSTRLQVAQEDGCQLLRYRTEGVIWVTSHARAVALSENSATSTV